MKRHEHAKLLKTIVHQIQLSNNAIHLYKVKIYSCKLVCASRMRAGTLAILLVQVNCQILEQDG